MCVKILEEEAKTPEGGRRRNHRVNRFVYRRLRDKDGEDEEEEEQRGGVSAGLLVICHRIRYPDKAIREKQIRQPRGFNSLVLHPDELLRNGAQLKLVRYERLQICLSSGLLPPVFIGRKGPLINLPPSGRRGRGDWGRHCGLSARSRVQVDLMSPAAFGSSSSS